LLYHKKLNFCEIHPNDAKALGIRDGNRIKIISAQGEIESEALITDTIREKTLFVPLSNREINYLTNDLLDSESMEPDYNHTPVRVVKI
jgi:ferredoxin-nitrate reductase